MGFGDTQFPVTFYAERRTTAACTRTQDGIRKRPFGRLTITKQKLFNLFIRDVSWSQQKRFFLFLLTDVMNDNRIGRLSAMSERFGRGQPLFCSVSSKFS